MFKGVDYWYGWTLDQFLTRDLTRMKNAGVQYVRISTNNTPHEILTSLVQNGISILGRFFTTEVLGPPLLLDAWGNYVYNHVLQHKNVCKVWEVWNEPDQVKYGDVGGPSGYVQLLQRAYIEAKRADPECTVLGASLSNCSDVIGYNPKLGLEWFQQMYAAGMHGYFDAIALHPYCMSCSPLSPNETPSGKAFWKIEKFHDYMVQQGDGNKKIWITEMGWCTNGCPSGIATVTEANQELWTTQAMELASSWSWCEAYFNFAWIDGGDGGFGLLRAGSPYEKPAYYSFKNFTSTLTKNYRFTQWQDGDTNPTKTVVM